MSAPAESLPATPKPGARERPSRDMVRVWAGVAVLALSGNLLWLKREHARVLADVRVATHTLGAGALLPRVPLQDATGADATLDAVCRSRPHMVAIITRQDCERCRVLAPVEQELRELRRDLDLVTIYGDASLPTSDRVGAGPADRQAVYRAAPAALASVLKVYTAPTVIVADSACRTRFVGTGLAASQLVLHDLVPVAQR